MNNIIRIKVFNLEKYLGVYSKESCEIVFDYWKRWYYEHSIDSKILVDMNINEDIAFEYHLFTDHRNTMTISQDEIIGCIESFDSRLYDDTFYANIIICNQNKEFIYLMKKMIKDDLLCLYISPYFTQKDENLDDSYENIKDVELFKATIFPLNLKELKTSSKNNIINLRYKELINSMVERNRNSWIDLVLPVYDIVEYCEAGELIQYEKYKSLLSEGNDRSSILLPIVLCDHYVFDIFDGDNWTILVDAYGKGKLDFSLIGNHILYDPCKNISNNYISIRLFKTDYLMNFIKRILNNKDKEMELSDLMENFFLVPFTINGVYDSFILRSFKESPQLLKYLEKYRTNHCN